MTMVGVAVSVVWIWLTDCQRLVTRPSSPGQIRDTSEPPADIDAEDPRSPLERLRTKPKKPLSVTDLVSPAWCELQYWYNLTRYGRIKRTVAMKRGSEIHSVLERQVYTEVPIQTETKEDRWGLRIWNVVQGLRTLRSTGMTRELELWGIIEGQVVNGILDEISYQCTDQDMEDSIARSEHRGAAPSRPVNQTTIAQFFAARSNTPAPIHASQGPASGLKLYLTDVKTRASRTIPKAAAMKSTQMQLMLYRKLLSDMATDSLESTQIFDRYDLNSEVPFSDSLLAQLSTLDVDFNSVQGVAEHDSQGAGVDGALTEILSHNSLAKLWSLMAKEVQLTLPQGASSVSKVLKAEYRSSSDGDVIGSKTFQYRGDVLEVYVKSTMAWWTGEREAQGVTIEEAFKCQICPFAESCTWRIGKVDGAIGAYKTRSKAKATVKETLSKVDG